MENRAVDKFPHTDRERGYVSAYRQGHKVSSLEVSSHVETVVLLSRETGPGTKFAYIDYEVKDSDQVSSRTKATYAEMKKWIEEEYNLKVHSAYIAQIKGKLGLEKERVGNNWKKGDGPSMPDCPPEKEKAIKAAFEHFGLI